MVDKETEECAVIHNSLDHSIDYSLAESSLSPVISLLSYFLNLNMSYDDLLRKLTDLSTRPCNLPGIFETSFLPLINSGTLSKLNERKFAAKYGPSLLSIFKQCTVVLKKHLTTDWQKAVLWIMKGCLSCLGKIHMQVWNSHDQYFEYRYAFIVKSIDCRNYREAAEEAKGLIEESNGKSRSPRMVLTEINVALARCNCLLQIGEVSVYEIEELYNLIIGHVKNRLISLKEFKLNSEENGTLNIIYMSISKLLLKGGRELDRIANGNIELHTQALSIKVSSLEFFEKVRSFKRADYFAFAYSAISGTFKAASASNSSELFTKTVNSIEEAFSIAAGHGISFHEDKNVSSLIELQSFLFIKLENFKSAECCLGRLIIENSSSIVVLLNNIRYSLEIARYSYLAKTPLKSGIERGLDYVKDLFESKLSTPVSLSSANVSELRETGLKVKVLFEN